MTHKTPAATLRAILEAIPHPGGLAALDELEHQRDASGSACEPGPMGPSETKECK